MKMKVTRILALALAAMLAVSMTACGSKTGETDTTAEADTTMPEAIVETTGEVPADATTDAATDASGETTEQTPDATEPADTTAADTTAAGTTEADTTAAESTTEAAKAPTDQAEILKLYNDATAKVAKQKVAFSKRRETKEGVYEAGLALKPFKDLVYKFMGIGAGNVYTKDVPKGDGDYNHYFLASRLTASDISSATCTLGSDGSYVVTINVKGGSSHIAGQNSSTPPNAPLDKTGIAAGLNDKGYWDHKTAQNVYDAIEDVASSAVIDESYSNAVVKATIDKDGNLTKLDVKFDITFDLSKVYGAKGHATGTTTVNFSNFKW